MSQRIWIVGGSSGIGLGLVKIWSKVGDEVVVSSRNAMPSDALAALQNNYKSRLSLVDIDVTDRASVLTVKR